MRAIDRRHESVYNQNQRYWLCCPKCGNKILMMLEETSIENFPLHCRKCKTDAIVNISGVCARAEQPAPTPLRELMPELKSQCQS